MHILLLGHTGFLGKNILKYCRDKQFRVTQISSKECDLKNWETLIHNLRNGVVSIAPPYPNLFRRRSRDCGQIYRFDNSFYYDFLEPQVEFKRVYSGKTRAEKYVKAGF